MLGRALAWLESRTGAGAALRALAQTPLPGGARWGRVWAPLLLALVALEALTGAALSAWYAPSTTDAWASVQYIQTEVALGWLLRGLHHVGGTLLVVVAVLHALQVVLWGAYRAPRELAWLVYLLALQVLIVVSHTGYLLPWDLRAYWATQVLVGIAGNQPLVGSFAQAAIQGGPEVGNATLTHLHALHVVLGPFALVALLAAWLWLSRRAGPAAPEALGEERARALAEPWSARQATYDLAAVFAAFLGLTAWVGWTGGVHLDGPADPAVDYVARPEWYFMPIFTLRHAFTGSVEFVATSLVPGLAVGFLAALPFLRARLERRGANARVALSGAVVVGFLGAVGLGAAQAWRDATDPKAKEIDARALASTQLARRLAASGVPVEGPLFLYRNDPVVWGERVVQRECVACHLPCRLEEKKTRYEGVLCLEGFASRPWITAVVQDPAVPHFFGNTKLDGMDPWSGGDEALRAIVEFLYAGTGAQDADRTLAEQGHKAYVAEGCEACHSLDGEGTGDAADLRGWASEDWLKAFIRQPDHKRFYGAANEMDPFDGDALPKEELAAAVAWLRAQQHQPTEFQKLPPVPPGPRPPKSDPEAPQE